ncbi:helix-turn-helix transcriptional regulator [Nocardia cyriacigeorgica]|jgi:proteasome accessory factor C|uniref:helix-turn-helix transcriptional regulator n=1 Tax=Nocardia cyriacigeorgica TaxID=135487 RepID=UPI0002E766AE|nr:YafY family protein [Nocardia cyriacigeorgica]AVH23331.1 YafY family transcriptional regulator [Nocardia cyriacigeorgica]MBF6322879.1 YafY family transcriptional regulator [Nocardia cyriacigeorgica]PPJ10240.1 YafY family transcriptional regulator [Nocardia cyriacigeorgica]TLF54415.1 YafY family transcriptional regulator [Nocardia cyriacigeorgica]
MSSRLSVRLSRLLNMVPYLMAHPGISAAEAAADLGVTTKQLMSDLNQLWMCGLPGYGPGDLIDLSFSEESIDVTFSAGIDRPLRLTSTEATALLVALRSIVDTPGMVDPSAAHSAIAKIEAAISGAAPETAGGPQPVEAPAVATVRAALAARHALRLVYYSASRDVVSERIVDPVRIVLVDNNSYLQAWCRQAEGVRLFRFDRIEDATELDEPARPPSAAADTDAALDLFQDDPALPLARLRIRGDYGWVMDQYPIQRLAVHPDGSIEATMRFATLDWMARLLLGFGSGVTVLGPPELVAAVRERSNAALAAYEEVAEEQAGPA